MRIRHTIAGLSLGLLMGAVAPVGAQDVDARWLPWLGCWQATEAPSDAGLLCVLPSQQASAVEVVRVVGSEIQSREVVWADGARHETARESCTGWEEGRFSEDGSRVYLRSEHLCEGAVQRGSGVMTMYTPDEWLDIRTAGMGDDDVAWVQRLHPASMAQTEAAGFSEILDERAWSARTARVYAAAPMGVEDVLEASEVLPTAAVEALLAERGDRLELNAEALLAMADAGLDESIIDVAVAVSFPERFALNAGNDVQRSALDQGSLRRVWGFNGMYGMYDPFYGGFGYSRYGYGYSPYGYSGYGGYGYGGYGGYYYGGYRPTVVVVDRVQSGPRGRVVRGRGYTRGSGASTGSTLGSGSARSGGASASSGRTGASGSSGKSTGRKAKRRGGGSL